MALKIHNAYGYRIWVAILYPDFYCSVHKGLQPYMKAGWWEIVGGDTAVVLGGDLSSKWMYYVHAEALDGTLWGNDVRSRCPHEAFQWCADDNITSEPWRLFSGVRTSRSTLTVHIRG